MTKLFQAFLTGIFITFILDFFIFLGIFLNYIKFYEIDVYYSILFWDYQNIYIYLIASAIFGFLVTFINNDKVSLSIVGFLFLLSLLTLIPTIGHSIGKTLLMQNNITLQNDKYTFIGDIYFDGRDEITFYDYELKKIIILNKKELK